MFSRVYLDSQGKFVGLPSIVFSNIVRTAGPKNTIVSIVDIINCYGSVGSHACDHRGKFLV